MRWKFNLYLSEKLWNEAGMEEGGLALGQVGCIQGSGLLQQYDALSVAMFSPYNILPPVADLY